MRSSIFYLLSATATVTLMVSLAEPVFGDGPSDRRVTLPQSIQSLPQKEAAPVNVADITGAVVMSEASVSNDGKLVAYISNTSGRLNVWSMTVDGQDARHLAISNERQATPVFAHEGKTVVTRKILQAMNRLTCTACRWRVALR